MTSNESPSLKSAAKELRHLLSDDLKSLLTNQTRVHVSAPIGADTDSAAVTGEEIPIRLNSTCSPLYDDGRKNCLKDILGKDDDKGDAGLCRIEKIKQVDPELYESLKKKFFRPIMSEKWLQNMNTWLNSEEISNVLAQYMEAVPGFYSFGAVPSDFIELGLWKIFKQASKAYDSLGGVMNLDPSWKKGSHWVAFFAKKNSTFFYYDSYAYPPPPTIRRLFKKLKKIGWLDMDSILEYNTVRHQYGHSECGMFSMIFTIMSAENGETNPKDNCQRFLYPKSDKLVESYRSRLFVVPPTQCSTE